MSSSEEHVAKICIFLNTDKKDKDFFVSDIFFYLVFREKRRIPSFLCGGMTRVPLICTPRLRLGVPEGYDKVYPSGMVLVLSPSYTKLPNFEGLCPAPRYEKMKSLSQLICLSFLLTHILFCLSFTFSPASHTHSVLSHTHIIYKTQVIFDET